MVFSLYRDEKGGIWLGTDEGASRYDGEHFVNFTTQDGLGNDFVWGVAEDREGNLWFGNGYAKGVSRYDGESIMTFSEEDGLGEDIKSIYQDRSGHLWSSSFTG